jgi:hypothetical protein
MVKVAFTRADGVFGTRNLESNYEKAMEHAIQAVDWRATGVRRAQRDNVAEADRAKPAMCPEQFVPIGMCDCDDH